MPQLDPFIIYTVKLAMDYQSVDVPTAPAAPQDEKAMLAQQDTNNPMFPETLARIMTIKSFPLKTNEKAPKLQRENILSLLYHAGKICFYIMGIKSSQWPLTRMTHMYQMNNG